MSDKLNQLQVMTIPAPLYNFGDLVEWSIGFGNQVRVYRGEVTHRLWCEDEPGITGYWEYGTRILIGYCRPVAPHQARYDTVTEDELKKFVIAL